MRHWQLQAAKARLSELIREVMRKGPHGITVRGREEVVLLTRADYDRLAGNKPGFVDFMAAVSCE